MENKTNLTAKNLSITATPVEGENYVHLDWTNLGTGYNYMVYSKGQNEAVYQSVPSKTNIKVLNIYPGVGNNLKGWMENANSESTNGYGKGLIKVDEVNIDAFNANPVGSLKDGNGNWKYDVIYMGAWDCNNSKNLNDASIPYIESFIKEGRGFLAGHDTIGYTWNNTGLGKLRAYFNIKIGNWSNNNTGVDPGYQYCGGFIGTNIQVKKKGLLTNYPWNIGDVGTKLTVPQSHSTSNFALGDIWMTYSDNATTSWNAPDSLKPVSNFYLTTWNNCAMIQTGHSNGAATPDEQKVLANTLFYLAQLTSDTSCDDHKAQDLTAPDKASITSVSNDDKNINVTYSKSNDNGTKYEYYVKATDGNAANDIISDTVSIINTVGFAGYSYVIDNIENTEPDSKIDTTDLAISAPLSGLNLLKPIYIHIKAIDNAGNASETTHYEYKYMVSLDLDKTAITLKEGAEQQLTAIANPSYSEVVWFSSDTSVATVDITGKVTAVGEGNVTITAKIDGSDIKAICNICVGSIALGEGKLILGAGEIHKLVATVSASASATAKIVWESSDPTMATVDAEGNVTAVGEGNVTITAKIDGSDIKVTCNVCVGSIAVGEGKLILGAGEIHKLVATVSASASATAKIVWESSDPTVATVDAEGKITVVAEGNVTITAKIDGSDIKVTCNVCVGSIAVGEGKLILGAGEIHKLVATVSASASATAKIVWESSDPTVATVDAEGNVTAVGVGIVTITAKIDGSDIKVTSNVCVGSVSLDKTEITLREEASEQITTIIAPPSMEVIWSSSDTSVATVSVTGKVTAVKKGQATITATITNGGSLSAACIVTVKKKIILDLEPEKNKIHLKENAVVHLTIDNIKEISAEDAIIKYDSTKLKFLGMTEVKGIKLVKLEQDEDELRVITASRGLSRIVNDKKILLKLYFKGIASGEALVDVTKGKVSDGKEMETDLIDDECGQATIIIDDVVVEDVNHTGEFTLLDLAIDGRHLGEDPKTLPQYNTDQVIDGAIDDNDLTKIGEYMLANPNYKFN